MLMLADLISDDGVVDDGFRDSVNFLKRYGLQVEMPYHLRKDLVSIAQKKPMSPA